jgi:hypothetical protein
MLIYPNYLILCDFLSACPALSRELFQLSHCPAP